MKSWATKRNTRIVKILKGRSNSYLIVKDDQAVLVDTGMSSAFNSLIQNIKKVSHGSDFVSKLILTHTHYDHCQSAQRLKEYSNCKIMVSDQAKKSIQQGYTKLPCGTLLITKALIKAEPWFGKKYFSYEPFHADISIKGDTEIKTGSINLKIIETKGHSADSISILVDDEIAIVGDAMFGVFRNSIFPPFANDVPEMIKSWGKLLKTDCHIFLPGHGKAIKRSLLMKSYKNLSHKHKLLTHTK